MQATQIRDQLRTMVVEEIAPQFMGTSIEHQRATYDGIGAQAEMPAGLMVARANLAGVPLEYLTPTLRERRVILHVHGGGFSTGSCESHRALAGRIGMACRARVVLPEYRLAPEHPFPAGLDDLLAVYRALLSNGTQPEQIIIVGDSAGGGLAVSLVLRAREAGLPMPRALVLLSPWLDLTCSGESMQTRAEVDPLVTHELLEQYSDAYLAGADPTHPLLSPLEAELVDLPPMLIQVGDQEILLSDAERMFERAQAAGVEVEFEAYANLWHLWHLFATMLPDAVEAIDRIGAYVDSRFATPAMRITG
jgi:monoterpene epsilon-lactone hydrolase